MIENKIPIELDINRIEAQFNMIGLCIDEKWPLPFVEKFHLPIGGYYYRILSGSTVFEILQGAVVAIDLTSRLAIKVLKNNQPRVYRISASYDPSTCEPISELVGKTCLTPEEMTDPGIFALMKQICKYCAYYERLRKRTSKGSRIEEAINTGDIISDLPPDFINLHFFTSQESYFRDQIKKYTQNLAK